MARAAQIKKSTATIFAAGILLAGPQDLTSENSLDFTTRFGQTAVNRPTSKQPLPFPFFVIDVETTGFSTDYASIIEIAALRVDSSGDEILFEEFQTLVKPPGNIPKKIRELTGISNEMVADAPNIIDALRRFKVFVGDGLLIAHSASFDRRMLEAKAKLMGETFAENEWVCSLLMAKRAWPDRREHTLRGFQWEFERSEQSHRAMGDVRIGYEVFSRAYDRLGGLVSLPPLEKHEIDDDDNDSVVEYDADLSGEVYVFTGFRDEVLAARIENAGGVVKSGISKQVTVLLVKSIDQSTTKVKKAREYKIEVRTRESFVESFYL